MLLQTLCFVTNADYRTCPVTNVGIEISFNWDFALMFHAVHASMYSCGANPSRTTELCTCFPFTLILPFPEWNGNLNLFSLSDIEKLRMCFYWFDYQAKWGSVGYCSLERSFAMPSIEFR